MTTSKERCGARTLRLYALVFMAVAIFPSVGEVRSDLPGLSSEEGFRSIERKNGK